MTTGFVTHNLFLEHNTGSHHPERPERLTAIHHKLDYTGTYSRLQQLSPFEADRDSLTQIHSEHHIDYIREASALASSTGCDRKTELSPDTAISPATFAAATLASGGTLAAVDAVVSGAVDNAFCAHRPPGHHAERDQAMGFCYFNHVAIAARYLQRRHGIQRIAIIDWDVHHGNGTQHAFETDGDVFFFSIHQYPHYPGTGSEDEIGIGDGTGTTLNTPVSEGMGDKDYRKIFAEIVRPAIDAFAPKFILLSAGFDAHRADPLGGIRLTEDGFQQLTEAVLAMARDHCGGALVSVLEGGYDLESTATSVDIHLQTLCS